MAWVYLDDQFPDHPKVALAGGDAGWLFVCGLAYIKRYATEGAIPKGQVPKLSDRKSPQRLAKRLVDVGLWEDDGDHYRVHDYHDWNKPQESRSAAARKAAKARWGNRNGHQPDPPDHANADAESNADAMRDACESHSGGTASGHASECPPPHTPTEEPTSSDLLTTVSDELDDDQATSGTSRTAATVGSALAVLASRDLADRQAADHLSPIADPVTWERKAYRQRKERHEADLKRLAASHPDATAEQLADLVEPPTAAGDRTRSGERIDHRYDEQQRATLARAERGMAQVAQLREVPKDDLVNKRGFGDARAALGPTAALGGS